MCFNNASAQLMPSCLVPLLTYHGFAAALCTRVRVTCSTERDMVDIERVEGLGAAPYVLAAYKHRSE